VASIALLKVLSHHGQAVTMASAPVDSASPIRSRAVHCANSGLEAPTPPPELDIPAWEASIAKLRAHRPQRLLLTHFGPHAWVDGLFDQLMGRLLRSFNAVTGLSGWSDPKQLH